MHEVHGYKNLAFISFIRKTIHTYMSSLFIRPRGRQACFVLMVISKMQRKKKEIKIIGLRVDPR